VRLGRSGSAVGLPEKSLEKETSRTVYFTYMGAETPQAIIMNFGLLGGLADVMNRSNFCIDRLRGFCSARG
jgi:hypothetical protein